MLTVIVFDPVGDRPKFFSSSPGVFGPLPPGAQVSPSPAETTGAYSLGEVKLALYNVATQEGVPVNGVD